MSREHGPSRLIHPPRVRRGDQWGRRGPRSVALGAGLFAVLLSGCQAHTGQPPAAAVGRPPGPAPAAGNPQDPGELQLRDGKTGAPLSREALTERLRAARAVYVGERHNSRSSHQAQLRVLEQVYALDPSVAVGVEMLPRTLQPQLDAYLARSLDEAGFLAAVDWQNTWGFDFALYQPLFEFCRSHGLRMYALNAPRDLAKAVRQRGVPGLTPAERAELPSGYPWPAPEAHRRLVQEVFARHSFGGEDKRTPAERVAAFERFYTAQLVWDESMAQGVAAILGGPHPPARVVVLAGVGHVGRFAIPARAARRGVQAGLALAPVTLTEQSEEPPSPADEVDVQIILPAPAHPPSSHPATS